MSSVAIGGSCYICGGQYGHSSWCDKFQPVKNSLRRAANTDVTVHKMTKAGRSLEEIISVLVEEKDGLISRVMQLEGIAPRKIPMPDGRVVVWRCPDHLIPEP